jgi:hypothetical protein
MGLVGAVEESPVNLVGLEMIETREGKSAGGGAADGKKLGGRGGRRSNGG